MCSMRSNPGGADHPESWANARDAMLSGGQIMIGIFHAALDQIHKDPYFTTRSGNYACLQ